MRFRPTAQHPPPHHTFKMRSLSFTPTIYVLQHDPNKQTRTHAPNI